jgi:hypothetical protein
MPMEAIESALPFLGPCFFRAGVKSALSSYLSSRVYNGDPVHIGCIGSWNQFNAILSVGICHKRIFVSFSKMRVICCHFLLMWLKNYLLCILAQ